MSTSFCCRCEVFLSCWLTSWLAGILAVCLGACLLRLLMTNDGGCVEQPPFQLGLFGWSGDNLGEQGEGVTPSAAWTSFCSSLSRRLGWRQVRRDFHSSWASLAGMATRKKGLPIQLGLFGWNGDKKGETPIPVGPLWLEWRR